MNFHRKKQILFAFVLLLTACAQQAQAVSPTAALPPPAPPTEVPIDPATEVPSSTDPSLFGALSKSEIDPLAANIHEAIFTKIMDGYIASDNIIDYQIITSEVFPSSDGTLIAEIHYNVRTADTSWLVDGGTLADDHWINDKCSRFDFVNTETEFQLKNRRTCN